MGPRSESWGVPRMGVLAVPPKGHLCVLSAKGALGDSHSAARISSSGRETPILGPSGDSRFSVPASVSSVLSTWWGLPLPKTKMREVDRSRVPAASSVITPCHHPCTHLEDMGHPCLQGIPQSFPTDLGLFSLLRLIFLPFSTAPGKLHTGSQWQRAAPPGWEGPVSLRSPAQIHGPAGG